MDIPLLLTVVTVLAVSVVLLVVGLALVMRQAGVGRGASTAAESLRQSVERREAALELREHDLTAAQAELSEAKAALAQAESALHARADQVEHLLAAREQALVDVAGLTQAEARAEVLAAAEREARLQAAQQAREIEAEAKQGAETKARALITTAVQRLAAEQTSESVVTAVALPSEEMKGRLIGREGRNIRSFEQITGVNLLIDDNPESVLLSCFDPVRRETARLTLVELIEDGRIHPARIEEAHERSRERLSQASLRAAEDAVLEMGITDLSPELLPVLGSLQFRTSYGQNVLRHLIECGHIAGLLAAELGLDEATCRRAAFLHDIGKGLSHQEPGSHALAGAALARRAGEHPDIVHAIEAHHNEVEPRTVEAILTQAADAISGSRPGARRESVELYVKRLAKLEELAGAHRGVQKVFAMQAGREIRVMVAPEQVSDAEAAAIAKDIAKQVELQLTYPGNIRVTVVRESRATALARRPVNAG
ncbi:ribonuclease Y [Propionicimonas paludicola]|uniref:Ribonuclease Y n=1 Tax=Propionicimonas paludicola TaxID=185243 RepID=A0A2A9CR18_9ACTN|nr:ribonuclease Y [Propionicimonas paludicola]PFG16566.1 ribonuclease Y [Propionicimonas paludicola]